MQGHFLQQFYYFTSINIVEGFHSSTSSLIVTSHCGWSHCHVGTWYLPAVLNCIAQSIAILVICFASLIIAHINIYEQYTHTHTYMHKYVCMISIAHMFLLGILYSIEFLIYSGFFSLSDTCPTNIFPCPSHARSLQEWLIMTVNLTDSTHLGRPKGIV